METQHANLVEFSNSYLVEKKAGEGHAARSRKKMRDMLARLRQIKNNLAPFLDDDGRAMVGLYTASLDDLDNALSHHHNANDLSPVTSALADFKRKRDCVLREVNRQFFNLEGPDAQCEKEHGS